MTFKEFYNNLLILQYSGDTKAQKEISAIISQSFPVFEDLYDMPSEFDINQAQGVQLDIIGRIIGLTRKASKGDAINYIGFVENPNMLGWDSGASLFNDGVDDLFTEGELLNDSIYRRFIKAKIAQNNIKTDILSLQELFGEFFDYPEIREIGTLELSLTVNTSDKMFLTLLVNNELLPTPQGVSWKEFIYKNSPPFGFKEFNDRNKGLDFGFLTY